jgi:alkylhydroperoxidase family enzyme
MPRVPYLFDDQISASSALLKSIRDRRPEGKLLNLDRILLYSEPLASAWQNIFGTLRQKLHLDGKFRELAILRIAIINHAPYEFAQHGPEALKTGVTSAQMDQLSTWESSSLFDERERAVLAYTDAMTIHIQVPDSTFARLKPWFNEQQVVELTALIAGYNMVSRFLEALQVSVSGE